MASKAPPKIYCTLQRAGPLVKECRAIRPSLTKYDTPFTRAEKNKILRPCRDSSVCHCPLDRVELRLALFGYEGRTYCLTIEDAYLPPKFKGVQKMWRRFLYSLRRWSEKQFDYVYLIEGRHGDHRYHIHLVLRDSDFSQEEIGYLWKYGSVYDAPLLLNQSDTYYRTARYFTKESTDGVTIPIGSRTCNWSRSLNQQLPAIEKCFVDEIEVSLPKDAEGVYTDRSVNPFGRFEYAAYRIPEESWNKI